MGGLEQILLEHPYLGVAIVFFACGLGLPLPEELVLVTAGYVCFRGHADLEAMTAACAAAILLGDIVPFALGRWLGLPLLRLKPVRLIITPRRLARFNRWFRRRGILVIFISRFVAGIRVVAFFTAGTLKMSWTKFLLIDLLGIALIVPLLVFAGYHFGGTIDQIIVEVQALERGILYTALGAATLIGIWYWLRWRRRQRLLIGTQTETYVEPSQPVSTVVDSAPDSSDTDPVNDLEE